MEILNYSIDSVKEFPLKKYYKFNKDYEYVLGIVTDYEIDKEILDEIAEKSKKRVVSVGKAELDNVNICFFEINGVVASKPLINSINKYLGNKNIVDVYFVPSLKELCINTWGEIIYSKIIIDNIKIDTRCI